MFLLGISAKLLRAKNFAEQLWLDLCLRRAGHM